MMAANWWKVLESQNVDVWGELKKVERSLNQLKFWSN